MCSRSTRFKWVDIPNLIYLQWSLMIRTLEMLIRGVTTFP